MLKIAAVSLLTYLFVCGCRTTAPLASLDGEAVTMKIVCNNNNNVKQDLLFRLRNNYGENIVVRDFLEELEIQAVFPLSRTPLYKVQDLQTDLRTMPGVITCDLGWSKTPADSYRPATDGLGRPVNGN